MISKPSAKPRPTALGLAIQKAWHDLPQGLADWSIGKLSLKPHSIEAQLFFAETSTLTRETSHHHAQLSEVVQHFKRLCQEKVTLSQSQPSFHDELWAPGFIEISEIPAQDSGL